MEACGLQRTDSMGVVHGLNYPCYVGSSRTKDLTHVSCIGRWIVIHHGPREILHKVINGLYFAEFIDDSF